MRKLLVIESNDGLRKALVQRLKRKRISADDAKNVDEPIVSKARSDLYSLALVDERDAIFKLKDPRIPVVLFDFVQKRPRQMQGLFDDIRSNKLAGIINKEGPVDGDTLVQCIEHHARYGRFPNGLATFKWKQKNKDGKSEVFSEAEGLWQTASERLMQALNTLTATFSEEEVAVLFRALISSCATSVELTVHGEQGHGGAVLLNAKIHYGDGAFPEHLAIKYGLKNTIIEEMFNYDRHVGPLPDGVAAQLRWRAQTETLAAIAYSWVDDSVESAEEFRFKFDSQESAGAFTWRRRRSVVNRLFHIALNAWYEAFRDKSANLGRDTMYLRNYYAGEKGLWNGPKDLANWSFGIPSFAPADPQWRFPDVNVSHLPNPTKWVRESTLKFNRVAPCHGDLHIRNIFLLPDDSPRLIDFGRTSLGHVFRDFAALEVSIRLKCHKAWYRPLLRIAEDAVWDGIHNLAFHLEHRLAKFSKDELDKFTDEQRTGLEDLQETIRATMDIRRAALAAVGKVDPRQAFQEYVYAVVMHLLKYAEGKADDAASSSQFTNPPIASPATPTTPPAPPWVWQALYGAARATEAARAAELA